LDLHQAIAAMAEAEELASASNRNSLAALYEAAAAESATRAAEAKQSQQRLPHAQQINGTSKLSMN
jgi:hypothetical protein